MYIVNAWPDMACNMVNHVVDFQSYVNIPAAYDVKVIPVWEKDADTSQLSEASLVCTKCL